MKKIATRYDARGSYKQLAQVLTKLQDIDIIIEKAPAPPKPAT
jgi:hypothetical protein